MKKSSGRSAVQSRSLWNYGEIAMDEYEDLDVHNGDAEHDMWVDFDYNENSGELSDLFEDADSDNY